MISIADIYEYRCIASRCEAGLELSLDDIERLYEGEGAALSDAHGKVLLRGHRLGDWVTVVKQSYTHLVAEKCPWMDEGDVVEVTFEDTEGGTSYRSKALVVSTEEDSDDLRVTLRFVGSPLEMRRPHQNQSTPERALARFAA